MKTKPDDAWTGDLRKEARWKEGRLATVSREGDEWPALTGDLSLGGIKLAVHSGTPRVGDSVAVALAFERELVEVRGVVQHVTEKPWGSIVGVEFEKGTQGALACQLLARRR